MKGQRVSLRFEGVSYNCEVWINGKRIGSNHDPFLPFEFPVEDAVVYGGENLITVRVDNVRSPGQFPLFEGWYGQGGILRDVSLYSTNRVYVRTAHVTAEPPPKGGSFSLRVVVDNQQPEPRKLTVKVTVSDLQGRTVATFPAAPIEAKAASTAETTIEGLVEGAQPWSPESPALYTAQVQLMAGSRELDNITTRFGFRRVETKDARILLNGKPVYLRGFNRHEDTPTRGMAKDVEMARADLTNMKQMGANFVRLAHYPHDPSTLDLCDELGLLVKTENAMNGWAWPADHPAPNPGFDWDPQHVPVILENSRRSIREMVHRDYNHPSIILCSTGNESREKHREIVEVYNEIIPHGRSLDPTRLWTHVSRSVELPNVKTFFEQDDVICTNAYPRMKNDPSYWQRIPPRVREWYPDKPIIISECGYSSGKGEDLQAKMVRAELEDITSTPQISGFVLWHYALHTWPADAYYSRGSGISPYGYMTRDRSRKFKSMAIIEEFFKKPLDIK